MSAQGEQTDSVRTAALLISLATRIRRAVLATANPRILPPELIADIIDLAVEMLVEEERYLTFQTPVTNHFLLSAALVDSTWHAIAVKALLKNGLVRPRAVTRFLARVEALDFKKLVGRVRFGAGAAGLLRPANDVLDGGEDDLEFQFLIISLPNVTEIELVGNGLRFRANLVSILRIKTLTLSYWRYTDTLAVTRKFATTPPSRLLIIEIKHPNSDVSRDPGRHNNAIIKFLRSIPDIKILSNQESAFYYLCAITRSRASPMRMLKRLHIEYTYPFVCKRLESNLKDHGGTTFKYPLLTHLATHLKPLHILALNGDRPSLTSLEILPDSTYNFVFLDREDAARLILELITKLEALATLKAPACYKTDAVDDLCLSKGVTIEWT
ncbi:hypothetical protein RQP46_000128 [Phenoliferia psychrophenolica]